MAIPPSFIQELIARADVVEVVGRHVQLKKTGANYSGLCPFHGEKTPSFSVSPTKQFFHCFGCGKSGNAIGFLMEHSGMNFVEAVKDLAQGLGMPVPDDERSPQERARDAQLKTQQATLVDVLEKAAKAYQQQLKASPRAVDYLKNRGLSGAIAKLYGLGYAPEGWRSLASVFPDYDDALLVQSGLVIEKPGNEDAGAGGAEGQAEKKKYDRFRDRVMFPIRNIKGEFIGFGGRVLDKGEPKYLNSPETPVFSKGRELYGLFEARSALDKSGYVLVTEGYMDVVALAQLGFPNAVATLGTACTTEHVQKLFRFTDHVVFSFDGDGAGRRAARKALDGAIPFATDIRTAKFLFLPAEHDPDSFIREHGAEAFARYVNEAVPLSRFLIDSARDGCDLSQAEGRARFAAQAKPLWLPLPDGALKRQLLREIATLVALDERDLASLWTPAAAQNKGQRAAMPGSRDGEFASDSKPKYYKNNSKLSNKYDGEPPFSSYENRAGGNSGNYGNNNGSSSGTSSGSNGFGSAYEGSRRALPGRAAPTSRADRALQIVLLDNPAWEGLSSTEHHSLSELPAPHGALFAWLDAQIAEHGAQSWGALAQALRGHQHEAVAHKLVASLPENIHSDPEELRSIVRDIGYEAEDREREALAQDAADPVRFARFKVLLERLQARSKKQIAV